MEENPIPETYDPSWPYNFKWGYDHVSGRTIVWRTVGGIDGRPYHRVEFEKHFGREPQVREGDIMGLALYTPAERKLDGTVVAPAAVLLQPYYNAEIPQGVYDYFNEVFSDTAIRRAKIAASGDSFDEWAPDLDSSEEEVIKWVWNREYGSLIWQADDHGLPTHEQKIESEWERPRNPKDYIGYAVPTGTTMEMETYRAGTPPHAVQAIKQKLAELYPDQDILLPQEFATDHGVDFQTDPGTYARRRAVIAWVETALEVPTEVPLEAPVSAPKATVAVTAAPEPPLLVRGLRKIMGIPVEAASGADKEGAMIAIFIPAEVGEKIKQKDGEPVEDMHVTLAYFSEKADERDDWNEVERIVEQIAKQNPKLIGKIGGLGVFQNGEDGQVLWASPSIPGLAELRDDIVEAVEEAGFPVSQDHGWTPHITLKYEFTGKLPKIKNHDLDITELSFAMGDDHKHFKFEGGFEKEAAEDRLNWQGWQGPWHFVTDGKEILKDPESADGLEDEFYRRFPDARGVTGTAYPTADKMGYGIYSPRLGWGSADDPQIHEVVHVLDQELGKPTHVVDHSHFDPELYDVGH